ncbi:hypothetical protein K470DRAFT_269030 [Piedraia hortae CBS 480.64]|uniref:von Willebrand and RING finger domain-containing protein n=1 Tax=Piedraia hortae CBS 480.64 TaxID=1314780 RepID=A0A6A7C4E5_9PEZI|nr:hypothetical protein K470DRAFT_269030 [Piedraia hortae CBS 480.64]
MSIFADAPRASRREKTLLKTDCAVCDEPLQYTLKGEKILQLACGHVSHEACCYEYLREFQLPNCPACDEPLSLDARRGGDVDAFNRMLRSFQPPSPTATWEAGSTRRDVVSRQSSVGQQPRDLPSIAERALSVDTGLISTIDESEANYTHGRRHDYDVQSMETDLGANSTHCGSITSRNPIPPPTLTLRSEFPTLSRSRQPQSLTCLVTVEVVEGQWRPDPEDFGIRVPPVPATPTVASTARSASVSSDPYAMQAVKDNLYRRVDNWHGLNFSRFGGLLLHANVRVGKDRVAWQDLECYLFTDMLICVKEKKVTKGRCTLKGSILIKKHLRSVEANPDNILTLHLSVAELPAFHLQFRDRRQLEVWQRHLLDVGRRLPPPVEDRETSSTEDDENQPPRPPSVMSSNYGGRSQVTAPTEYSVRAQQMHDPPSPSYSLHVPLDIVVVIPLSSSIHGLKITLLRDALRFIITNLSDRDRMGLVTFGCGNGGVPLVGMTSKNWLGWANVLDSLRPLGSKNKRADAVEGANVAMDLLMQRRSSNPLSSILLICDSPSLDQESIDFVVSRAEAAKIPIYSFGLGLSHKPDALVELSGRTKGAYIYVKDWMMLRECVAGCLGALQSTSHGNVELRLQLPDGSPAKFVKISGALHVTKRAGGRDAQAILGDLRFGDKRDILVQLAIEQDAPIDATASEWENVIAGLEALGGPFDSEGSIRASVEEVPLITADLTWAGILKDNTRTQLSRPSLLTIPMLPPAPSPPSSLGPPGASIPAPIPPHPSIVQRRMELLTSDMLSRALMLVSKGHHERAAHLLSETRPILKGLGKGGLPPLPPPTPRTGTSATMYPPEPWQRALSRAESIAPSTTSTTRTFLPAAGIDPATMAALDAELVSSLEWMPHPAIFLRDSRKAVLQAIGVISSQRGYSFRSPAETLWAERITGVRRLVERSREWRDVTEGALVEEI